METITFDEFQNRLDAQNVPLEHKAFKCPMCGTVQSAHDLIVAGAGKSFEDIQRYIGFSCVGRWKNSGPFNKKKSIPGNGCDWTLGGFFQINKLEVILDSGKKAPCFEIASPEEAQNHMNG